MSTAHPNPLCPMHNTNETLIGCPCNFYEDETPAAKGQVKDLVAALEESLVAAKRAVCERHWPDCVADEYDPRCCRFPKSCSAPERAGLSNIRGDGIDRQKGT